MPFPKMTLRSFTNRFISRDGQADAHVFFSQWRIAMSHVSTMGNHTTDRLRAPGATRILLAAAMAMSLGAAQVAGAADGVWTEPSGGSWNVGGNWAGGTIASGAGFTADFDSLDTSGTVTVTLDAPRTIGNLVFGDDDTSSATTWVLSGGAGAPALTLEGDSPTITVNALGSSGLARIDAVIDGEDGLTKSGAGILSLNNANTYTGGTTISQGALRVQNSEALGSGAVQVASGGRLQLHGGVDIANAVTINGSSALHSNSGHNTISGLVTLGSNATAAGQNSPNTSLTLTDVNLGSHTLSVATGAANTGHVIISGTITGTGGISKSNVGDLTISQDNTATYSGTTTHKRGILHLGSDGALGAGSLQWVTDNDQMAAIRSVGADTRTITNDVAITAQNTQNTNARHQFGSAGTGDLIFSGDITLTSTGNGNRRLQVLNDTTRFDGSVAGSGRFSKEGSGTLVLNGDNTYSGDIAVEAGTLLVNGSNNGAGSVTVSGDATLGGVGSIAGDVTFNADAAFLALLDGALDIGGQVTIADGALITTDDILTLSSYTVLTHGLGSLSGTFTVDDSITSQGYSVVYDDTSVSLVIPEPASLALLGLGGLLIAVRRRTAAATA